jgi:hypothetical protein
MKPFQPTGGSYPLAGVGSATLPPAGASALSVRADMDTYVSELIHATDTAGSTAVAFEDDDIDGDDGVGGTRELMLLEQGAEADDDDDDDDGGGGGGGDGDGEDDDEDEDDATVAAAAAAAAAIAAAEAAAERRLFLRAALLLLEEREVMLEKLATATATAATATAASSLLAPDSDSPTARTALSAGSSDAATPVGLSSNGTLMRGVLRKAHPKRSAGNIWRARLAEVRSGQLLTQEEGGLTAPWKAIPLGPGVACQALRAAFLRGSSSSSFASPASAAASASASASLTPTVAGVSGTAAAALLGVDISCVFEIVSLKDGARRLWMADSEAARDQWVAAICAAIVGATSVPAVPSAASSVAAPAALSSPQAVASSTKPTDLFASSQQPRELDRYLEVQRDVQRAGGREDYLAALSSLRMREITVPVAWCHEHGGSSAPPPPPPPPSSSSRLRLFRLGSPRQQSDEPSTPKSVTSTTSSVFSFAGPSAQQRSTTPGTPNPQGKLFSRGNSFSRGLLRSQMGGSAGFTQPLSRSLAPAPAPTKGSSLLAQLWKDLGRDSIAVNGRVYLGGELGGEVLVGAIFREVMEHADALRMLVGVAPPSPGLGPASGGSLSSSLSGSGSLSSMLPSPPSPALPFELDEAQALGCVREILMHCNRTQSGGDAYSCISALVGRQELVILCPSSQEAAPLEIDVDIIPISSLSRTSPMTGATPICGQRMLRSRSRISADEASDAETAFRRSEFFDDEDSLLDSRASLPVPPQQQQQQQQQQSHPHPPLPPISGEVPSPPPAGGRSLSSSRFSGPPSPLPRSFSGSLVLPPQAAPGLLGESHTLSQESPLRSRHALPSPPSAQAHLQPLPQAVGSALSSSAPNSEASDPDIRATAERNVSFDVPRSGLGRSISGGGSGPSVSFDLPSTSGSAASVLLPSGRALGKSSPGVTAAAVSSGGSSGKGRLSAATVAATTAAAAARGPSDELVIRVRMRSLTSYRICCTDPQGTDDDTWGVVGCLFWQTFVIRSRSPGKPVASSKFVTLSILE